MKTVPGLPDEQKTSGRPGTGPRGCSKLADYLAGEDEAIAEYRHELWRLANWRAAPEAGDVPFHDERIATKAGETKSQPTAWVESGARDQGGIPRRLAQHSHRRAARHARQPPPRSTKRSPTRGKKRLRIVNLAVTALTIGVGICLLLGFFTRLASLAGALFLLAVIASQPPWLADRWHRRCRNASNSPALLVLAGTGAGRWLGLDYFTYALFHRNRGEA